MQSSSDPSEEASGKRPLAAVGTDPELGSAKRLQHTASKLHGTAPKRRPRIGPEYQVPALPSIGPPAVVVPIERSEIPQEDTSRPPGASSVDQPSQV